MLSPELRQQLSGGQVLATAEGPAEERMAEAGESKLQGVTHSDVHRRVSGLGTGDGK